MSTMVGICYLNTTKVEPSPNVRPKQPRRRRWAGTRGEADGSDGEKTCEAAFVVAITLFTADSDEGGDL